jgi:radical SAM superfamily enzyme YgiQ (UPF0313 family)
MPRALLIYPQFPETFWGYQRALRFLGLRATHPPLGLLTVAGMLSAEDYELRLVDFNVRELKAEDLHWADIVLTGGMMIQRPSVERIVEQCLEAQVPVVIGGPDATSSSRDLPGTAHLVLGEAESPRFVSALREMAVADTRIILDLRNEPQGISVSPLPRYDLIQMKRYASMALQMSRGCPFKCEFCNIPSLFGNRTRYKSAATTLAELDALFERGWKGSVFWVDDNFIGNKKACKEILSSVLDWQQAHGMPFQFYTQASVNLAADHELVDLMGKAGFDSVFVGIETPIEESLRETGKLQNTRFDLLESVKKLQRAGMEVMGGFIIGFDSDPIDIDRHLVRFIQASGIPVAMTGLLTALPGSPLHDRFQEEGRLLDATEEQEGNNTFQFGFNFKTVQDAGSMIKAYKNVLLEVYGKPENYFRRVTELYRNLGRRVASNTPFTLRRLRACLCSFLMIPTSKYGWSYGKFLLRTLLRYPSRFQDAVRRGIVGLHFYQLTRERLAIQEFHGLVNSGVERVREAYAQGHQEGVKLAAQILADGRKRLKKLPGTVRDEMETLYEELEQALTNLAVARFPVGVK